MKYRLQSLLRLLASQIESHRHRTEKRFDENVERQGTERKKNRPNRQPGLNALEGPGADGLSLFLPT